MAPSPSLQFSTVVRALANAARANGLHPPTFRSPPGLPGADRTVRRRPDGSVAVAVAMRDRPWAAVLADCVEGVLVANDLAGADAVRARTALWTAIAAELDIVGTAA